MDAIKSLGRYQIKGVLGKGAMGLVYDALDPKLDRRVAIKTILTRTLDEATARHYSMRFKREVRAVARLNHRNIVQVYDFGNEGDLAYQPRARQGARAALPERAQLRRGAQAHRGGQAARRGRSRDGAGLLDRQRGRGRSSGPE